MRPTLGLESRWELLAGPPRSTYCCAGRSTVVSAEAVRQSYRARVFDQAVHQALVVVARLEDDHVVSIDQVDEPLLIVNSA